MKSATAFFSSPSGSHDAGIQIGFKTSASLVENNIVERIHGYVVLESGAAGNVVSYNYAVGEPDNGAANAVTGGIDVHGTYTQFNLLEGNVLMDIYADPITSTIGRTTAYRNWLTSTNRTCSPAVDRGGLNCFGADGTIYNFVGNVAGSAPTQSVMDSSNRLILPPSFYLSSMPNWWGTIPFPATGPEITGGNGPGGHSYGNPAKACYDKLMAGLNGGVRGLIAFSASACYGSVGQRPQPPTGLTATSHTTRP